MVILMAISRVIFGFDGGIALWPILEYLVETPFNARDIFIEPLMPMIYL